MTLPASAAEYLVPEQHERAAEADLISFADPGPHSRILVFGSSTLELQCALLRQGCTSVTTIRPGLWPRTDAADLVLWPLVDSQERLAHAIAEARRVLAPLGTLALHLTDTATSGLVRQCRRMLALHGFEAVRVRPIAGGTACRAELPLRCRLSNA